MDKQQILETVLRVDEIYQKLLGEYRGAEKEFCTVLRNLPVEDREILERYISLGEELDHRRSVLALELYKTSLSGWIGSFLICVIWP